MEYKIRRKLEIQPMAVIRNLNLYIAFVAKLLMINGPSMCFYKIGNVFYDVSGNEIDESMVLMFFPSLEDDPNRMNKIDGHMYYVGSGIYNLLINYDMCLDLDELIVVAHEMRHAFQLTMLSRSKTGKMALVDRETLDAWEKAVDDNRLAGEEDYSTQATEIDANLFSLYINNILFHFRFSIDGMCDDEIREAFEEEFLWDYPKSMIEEYASSVGFDYTQVFEELGYTKK